VNRKLFGLIVVIVALVVLFGGKNCRAAEWRNGVYYPTRPGDQMYSYYHGTPRGTVHRPPPRYYQPPHRHYYAPPVYRHVPVTPNVRVDAGRHGSVDVGPIHIRW